MMFIGGMEKWNRYDSVLWQNPLHQRKYEKAKWHKTATKIFDDTDCGLIRAISWSNDSRPTGVVNRVRDSNLPTNRKTV